MTTNSGAEELEPRRHDDPRIIQTGDLADGLAGAVGAAVGRTVLDRMIFIEGARRFAPTILKGKTDAEVLAWIARQVELGKPGGPKGCAYELWDKLVHEARHRGEELLLHSNQNVALTDGTILDQFGSVLSEVQQKATFDAAYIRRTLRKLPEGVVIHVPRDCPLPPDLRDDPRVIRSGPTMKDLTRGLKNASTPSAATIAAAATKAGVYGALIGIGLEGLNGGYHVLVKGDRAWEDVAGDVIWNGAIAGGLSGAGCVIVTVGLAAVGVTGLWVPILVSIPVGIAVGKTVKALREPVSQVVGAVWQDVLPTSLRELLPSPLLALLLPAVAQGLLPVPAVAAAVAAVYGARSVASIARDQTALVRPAVAP